MRFTIGRIRRTAALSAVLLASGVAAALAQQQGSISGVVTDRAAGTPLGSVRVSVLNTNRSTLTNQQGRYTMQALPAGTYQVQAAIIGYAAVTSPATVTPGQAAVLYDGDAVLGGGWICRREACHPERSEAQSKEPGMVA